MKALDLIQLIQYTIDVKNIDIKITSKQSIYLELAEKIESLIKLGVYKENEKLPSCRKLGVQLGVSPNTIERVYSLLEERGVIYTLPKKGIFVKGSQSKYTFQTEIINTLKHFKENNVTKEELEEYINIVYKEGEKDDCDK